LSTSPRMLRAMERHDETFPLPANGSPGKCVWCEGPTQWVGFGPRPIYCSHSCRQRAYESRRAAAAGLVAKEVVRVQEPPTRPPAPPPLSRPDQLNEITRLLDSGRLYDRDLTALAAPLRALVTAYERRVRSRYQLH
jgi:hypothetical protein